jgi:hypothetical protein
VPAVVAATSPAVNIPASGSHTGRETSDDQGLGIRVLNPARAHPMESRARNVDFELDDDAVAQDDAEESDLGSDIPGFDVIDL